MKVLKTSFHNFTFSNNYITKPDEADSIIKKLLDSPTKLYGLDIETAKKEEFINYVPFRKGTKEIGSRPGLCPLMSTIRLVQVYDGDCNVYIFDISYISLESLRPLLYGKRFVAHYALFEIKHFTHNGFPDLDIGCSMLLSQLIYNAENSPYEPDEDEEDNDENKPKGKKQYHSLAAVTKRYLDVWPSKEFQASNWNTIELSNDQLMYAGLDAVLTYKLASQFLAPLLVKYKMQEVYKLLKGCQHSVADMELNGIGFDWQAHEKVIDSWKQKLKEAADNCLPYFSYVKGNKLIQVNLNSPKQMNEWLRYNFRDKPDVLNSWPKTNDKPGNDTYTFTQSEVFPFKGLPAIAALFEYKKYYKLVHTYGEPYKQWRHPVTGRIHTSFTLGETVTGRMSSREPNLQQLPRDGEMRSLFKPSPGNMYVAADFGQIELRVQAEYSRDPNMLKVFRAGDDIYSAMASAIVGRKITKKDPERQTGKAIMLSLGYGMRPKKYRKKVAEQYDIYLSEEVSTKHYQTYHNTFKVYSDWCDRSRENCRILGFARSKLGKMRRLLEDEIYTKGPNHEIQSTSFEVLGLTMNECRKRKSYLKMCCVVHDDLKFECPIDKVKEGQEIVKECMEKGMLTLFPLAPTKGLAEPSSGFSWAEAK